MIVLGAIDRVANEFRCHTSGRFGTKACDTGSKSGSNKGMSYHTPKRYVYRTGTALNAI